MTCVLRARANSGLALLAVAAGLGSCSPKVSETPLPNARPEGPNTYYYGTPDHGGKELGERQVANEPHRPLVLPKPPAATKKKPVQVAKKDDADKSSSSAADGGVPKTGGKYAGRYLGTDTVTIDFPGIPGDPQVDDKAVVDIKKLSEEDKYELTVVASNNGEPLCTISGTLSETRLEFAEGQPCFSEILGIPLDTSLAGGSATFDGKHIDVEFEVELSLDTPGGALEGGVSYSFDGEREASDEDDAK